MSKLIRPAIGLFSLLTVLTGIDLPARRNRDRTRGISRTSHRKLDLGGGSGAGFRIDRPTVQ